MMHHVFKSLAALAVVLLVSCEADPASGNTPEGGGTDLAIEWEAPQQVKIGSTKLSGGYPRVHRLADGRLMLSYTSNGNACAAFSSDDGKTWKSG